MDADRLEGPRRRVLLVVRLVAQRLAHDVRQLAGARQRARGDDRLCDAARTRLLAIVEKDVGDLRLVRFVDEVGGGHPLTRHTHRQRPVLLEAEAALGLIELHRRDADIHGDAIHGHETARLQFAVERRKGRLDQHQPAAAGRDDGLAAFDRVRIAVKGGHLGSPLEERQTVATGTKGRVDDARTGLDRERIDGLVEEHRDVRARAGQSGAHSVTFFSSR